MSAVLNTGTAEDLLKRFRIDPKYEVRPECKCCSHCLRDRLQKSKITEQPISPNSKGFAWMLEKDSVL